MKKLFLISSLLITSFLCSLAQAQTEPWKYGHWLNADEPAQKGNSNRSFVETDPPASPVRNVAEFDRMQGALVRYPFGIPMSLIKEMAEDVMVTTIVNSNSQKNTVLQQYINNGVDTSHCNFLIAPSDSYWTRDYGPWFESDSANNIGIVDFPYNRPTRPNDDEIPKKVAEMLGIQWYGMNVIHTGGNYMTDGMGISSSTDLVWTENPTQTHDQIAQKMHNYLGIESYKVVPDPNGTYIDHIDCWGKFLAPDKILIRKVLPTHSQYAEIENMAAYWASQVCSYGYNYNVYRVMTQQDQPYTNSIILNNKALIPFMNSAWDDSAKAVYEAAMPGYQVIGFTGLGSAPWVSTDALHCRVMGIADLGLLYIRHIPLTGNQPAQDNFILDATLIPCSDSAIYNDSVLIYFKVNNGSYQVVHMTQILGYNYTGIIPKQTSGSIIRYYLYAADQSGRHATAPFIGAVDPYTFTAVYTDLTAIPDTLRFHTYEECTEGKVTTIHNYTQSSIDITDLENQGIPSTGGCMWYIEPNPVTTLPYPVGKNDSVSLRVKVTFPVNSSVPGYALDTMQFSTPIGNHGVIILVNDSLLTGIHNPTGSQTAFLGNNYPNPFSGMTTIPFNPGKTGPVVLEILTVQGNRIRTLVNSLRPAGLQSAEWDRTDESGNVIPAGIYFYRMMTDGATVTRKLIVY